MGQYYFPACLDRKEYVYSHDWDNGLKLMEHSYIGNAFVEGVCALLMDIGPWGGCRMVWAGDYADSEDGTDEGDNIHSLCEKEYKKIEKHSYVRPESYIYLCNDDKKEVVDLRATEEAEANRWAALHPLPLLTAEGNGRGGGDFRDDDVRIGSWARDRIILMEDMPKDYELVNGVFIER